MAFTCVIVELVRNRSVRPSCRVAKLVVGNDPPLFSDKLKISSLDCKQMSSKPSCFCNLEELACFSYSFSWTLDTMMSPWMMLILGSNRPSSLSTSKRRSSSAGTDMRLFLLRWEEKIPVKVKMYSSTQCQLVLDRSPTPSSSSAGSWLTLTSLSTFMAFLRNTLLILFKPTWSFSLAVSLKEPVHLTL